MAFFGNLKNSLKQKWLQYFQSNRFWISLHSGAVDTPDGGKRPASYLILGIINALEPQLAELMLPFSKLNPNVDNLIDVLGLNFDPDLMLGNSPPAEIEVQEDQPVQVNNLLQGNFDRDETVVVISEAESLGSSSSVTKTFQEAESVAGGSSVTKTFQEQDAFTITSFDQITFDGMEAGIIDNNAIANSLDDFSDAFLDLGNTANLEFELTSNSEDEGQSQDAQDISGLFPNF